VSISEWSSSDLSDWSGSSVSKRTSDLSDWSSIGDWSSDFSNSWSSDNSFGNSWGRSVNNSVESVDWVSGVGNSSDSTIGLNKGVLSLDDISVSGFLVSFSISGESVLNGVSVGVLWVVVEVFGNDGSFKDIE